MMMNKDFLWLNLRDLPYFRAMLRGIEAQFYQEFELTAPTLDLGCGDGHFATIAFERKLDVGLDPWAGPIHKAMKGGGYRWLVQAEGGKMPFPDGFFGSALSNSVLEHVPRVEEVLAETRRVLKPGSPFIFCVPNPRYLAELSIASILKRAGLSAAGKAYTGWFRRFSRVQHAVEPETWQKWLAGVGFKLEKHWDYFSPTAMRVMEWGHLFGIPSLLSHAIFKRWIVAPYRWNLFLTERLVRRHAIAEPHPQGTFTFYIARCA